MVGVPIDAELVVFLGHFWVIGQEVQSFAVAEIGRDALRIELAGVLKVLDCLLVLTQFT